MSITQARMKSLVDAGESLANSYLFLANQIGGLVRAAQKGEQPVAAVLEAIEYAVLRPEAEIALQLIVVNKEMAHWKFTHTKNEQEARRAARRKAGLPAPRRQIRNKEALELSAATAAEWYQPVESTNAPTLRGRPESDPDAEFLGVELELASEDEKPAPSLGSAEMDEFLRVAEANAAWEEFVKNDK